MKIIPNLRDKKIGFSLKSVVALAFWQTFFVILIKPLAT